MKYITVMNINDKIILNYFSPKAIFLKRICNLEGLSLDICIKRRLTYLFIFGN